MPTRTAPSTTSRLPVIRKYRLRAVENRLVMNVENRTDEPMSAALLDLDHFKAINDSAGHGAGDSVLRQLRELLESCSRTSDIIVRWGGAPLTRSIRCVA